MVPSSPSWRMADRLAGGRLAHLIAGFEGSWDQAAKQLYADHGIEVTGETLRKWANALAEHPVDPDAVTA